MGDKLKKGLYFICTCVLSIIMFTEFQKNMPDILKKEDVTLARDSAENKNGGQKTDQKPEQEEEQEKKVAYLTFDDGPSEITPDILDTLKKKSAKATFFLVGNEITSEREDIVKRELEEGHSVGVHTYCHKKNEMYCDEKRFFEDFEMCRNRIKEVTGLDPTLHRFPWGSNNNYVCPIVDDIVERLKKEKIVSFDWNVSGEDSVRRNVPKATIYRNVAKDLEKYNDPIILLHDSNTMDNTAAVLGEILDLIQEKGYSFGTLDERDEYMFPEEWRR